MPVMDDALAIRISEADRLVVVGISGALDAYTARGCDRSRPRGDEGPYLCSSWSTHQH